MKVDIKDLSKTFTKQTEELLVNAAMNVLERAKQRCPVDTGNLRNSIVLEGAEGFTLGNDLVISAKAPYAAYVEYGTANQAPQAFMRPAAEEIDNAMQEANRTI